MQAASRKARPVWLWKALRLLINKVIHKKREQLFRLCFSTYCVGANDEPIVHINWLYGIDVHKLLGNGGLQPKPQHRA